MNKVSEQLLQAMDVLVDEKVSKLEYDKTIQAKIYSIVNLDAGEYKVRYNGNIFSAFANNLDETYEVDDAVYVTVPEGNFSNKKLITSLVSAQSLKYSLLAALQNAIFEISPEFNALYGGNLYDKNEEVGVIGGTPVNALGSYKYLYEGPNTFKTNGFHGLFLQYANNYELIRILADFQTRFYDVHTRGNYGIEVLFYAKGKDDTIDVVSYKLDLNAFNGDPYCLSIFSPQSVIIKVQKNYLLGLKSIKLFEEDFAYDRIVENGQTTNKYNTTVANIFVKNVSLQYVDQKDLTDTNYYLMIAAPQGIAFTSNVSSLDLQGRLVYLGKDIMDDKTCKCQWFIRDLTVMIGEESYDKDAGFGWRPLPQTSSLLSLDTEDVLYELRYKLLVVYNETVSLSAEIEIFNHNASYDYAISLITNGDDISLEITNKQENGELKADWFLSYPDGAYLALDKKKNKISVSEYLKYSSVVFYCQVYNLTGTHIIGTLEHTIVNSESSEDVTISYNGEDTFRYDANGDIAIEDTEKERTLLVVLTWKEGFGTAYTVLWLMRDLDGKEIPITGKAEDNKIEKSMIDKLWVDNYNILHYNVLLKFKNNFLNNTLVVKIKTITEQEYYFDKEILFLKDGDQGTNGTTYVIAVRPCDSGGLKLSGLQPLIYNSGWKNTLPLRCYVYKDGEWINNNSSFTIRYKWEGINISFTEAKSAEWSTVDRITARGAKTLSASSAGKDLEAYVKVLVEVDDKSNGRKTSIYAAYPIDIAFGGITVSAIDIATIPSYIKYTASGITPQFYSNNIQFYYNKNDITSSTSVVSMNKNILDTEEKDGLWYLKPASSFIAENIKDPNQSNIGVLKCRVSNSLFLIHPIVMYLDTYGNEAINGWDGEGIETVEDGVKSYILAPLIGAGEKDSLNRFTGVVMGKDTARDKIGLYGYQQGINTFGLMLDGIAYFGAKSGGGLIVIDGKEAHIYGGGLYPAGSSREEIGGNSTNGMSIYLANLNPSNPSRQYAIKIAKGIFNVMYDGSLTATSADITGKIYAQEGLIGCDEKHSGGWYITSNRIYSGTGSNRVALDSTSDSYFRIWAGKSEAGDSYSPTAALKDRIKSPAKFVVTKDGYVYMQECYIKGRIESGEGLIGGWEITSNTIQSSRSNTTGIVGMASSGNAAFWVGSGMNSSTGDNPLPNNENYVYKPSTDSAYFLVTRNGKLYCASAEVRGKITAESGKIGNWIIRNNRLENSEGTVYLAPDKIYGALVEGGTVSGSEIKGGSISIGSRFSVNNEGTMTCSNANIAGTINAITLSASRGQIGGWTITSNGLYGGNTVLSPNAILSDNFILSGITWTTNDDGTISNIKYELIGKIYEYFGSDGENDTFCLGLDTTSYRNLGYYGSIVMTSGRNLSLRARGAIVLGGGWSLGSSSASLRCTIPASRLEGIYARFA